ncbi:MAG: VCBS repeat-containing protein, partial [Planctomycetaceae bacterium]|nr:VCBS repeat-containing protein [Planctomycetaceae bacterium]
IDGDGDLDAATCAYGSELCVWYENDGRGIFTRHIVGDKQQAYDIRAVDLDGDEDLDLLVAGRASNNVVWYANPLKSSAR